METFNSKSMVDSEAESALKERLAWYSIIVTATDKNFQHGTGIPIIYKGKYFIVTCLHIVKDTSLDELRFTWRTEDPLITTQKDKLLEGMKNKDAKYREMEQLPIKQIHKTTSGIIDLAAIELSGEIKERDLDFFELNKSSVDAPQVGHELIMMGYPGEIAIFAKNKKTGKLGNIGFLHTDWPVVTTQKSESSELPDFDDSVHFLAEIDRGDQSVGVKGMSGCGIWSWEKEIKGKPWYPTNVKLVGIQCAQYEKSKLLLATRVASLFKLLDE